MEREGGKRERERERERDTERQTERQTGREGVTERDMGKKA